MDREPTAGTPAGEPNRRSWRRRGAALAVVILLVLVAFVVISRRPSSTSDEVQARAVALTWARAVGAKDGGVSWDNSAPAARGETRAKAVQDAAQSTDVCLEPRVGAGEVVAVGLANEAEDTTWPGYEQEIAGDDWVGVILGVDVPIIAAP